MARSGRSTRRVASTSTDGISAVVFDLDGVLRYWDPAIIRRAEERHGLPHGSIGAIAFDDAVLLRRAITSDLTDEAWRQEVATRLAGEHGPAAVSAVREWSRAVGEVKHEVLAIVRELRARRVTVALLSNATSRLPADLRRLGLDRELDLVVSSARLGLAKPDKRAFLITCQMLGAESRACAFVDDTAVNVRAAASVGMAAHHYSNVRALRGFLISTGLLEATTTDT